MGARPLSPPANPRVVLVHKQSAYEVLVEQRRDEHIRALIQAEDESVANMREVHERHHRSLANVVDALSEHPQVSLEVLALETLPGPVGQADLVVVVGGDGTALETSHHIEDAPLLAINSDPRTSRGYLCSGHASDAATMVRAYLSGELTQRPLSRLAVEVNGLRIGPPVLNDLLFAHACPAATSRYILEQHDERESQKSSGLWVSTAAGSTAAIRSAGGMAMPLEDQRLQFRVREPYTHPGQRYNLTDGWVLPGEHLICVSRMEHAGLYLDGPHIHHTVRMGDRVSISLAAAPLWQVQPAKAVQRVARAQP